MNEPPKTVTAAEQPVTTTSELAERNAQNIAAHQAQKAEVKRCSRVIHAFGGEQAVWDALEAGVLTKALCQQLDVHVSTFNRWVERGGEERTASYARARARGAHSIAEDALTIADEASPADVQVARLRVDTRKWIAGKLNPDEYSDKQQPAVSIDLGSLALDALRLRSVDKPVYDPDEDRVNPDDTDRLDG